jgi:iron-sulfur cluster assembly protein
MALDEPKDNDAVYEINGFKYLVNKEFLEKAQPIKVDFLEYGFKLTSNMEFQSGAGCRSCDSAGSCST